MSSEHKKFHVRSRQTIFRVTIVSFVVLVCATISGCSSDKQKATGDLKYSEYCKRYVQFEDDVSTASNEEQKKLLVKITEAKDFPAKPNSLAEDYKTVIEGYDKVLKGEDVTNQESTYKKASERINRHAADHCGTLESNSGSPM